jgi:AcrR family transcriptional regulator
MNKIAQHSLSRSEQKRQAILTAAKKVFLKQGFAVASMDRIAENAQVSKKTVYHHFNNKAQLFQDMLSEHWVQHVDNIAVLFNDRESIVSNLTRFCKIFLTFLYDKNTIDLLRVLISESARFPDLIDCILQGNHGPFTQQLIAFIQARHQSGELTVASPERAAAYFMGLLKEVHFWPMMLGFVKTTKPKNKQTLIDEAIAIFVGFYQVDPLV